MKKTIYMILFLIIFIIVVIETGMRFAIWHSLDKIIQHHEESRIYMVIDKNISQNWCSTEYHENYLTVFYTKWLFFRMTAKYVCQYQSPHIILIINTHSGEFFYHWSQHNIAFIKDNE